MFVNNLECVSGKIISVIAEEKKIMRLERLELPTFRSGVERATNCAKAPSDSMYLSDLF